MGGWSRGPECLGRPARDPPSPSQSSAPARPAAPPPATRGGGGLQGAELRLTGPPPPSAAAPSPAPRGPPSSPSGVSRPTRFLVEGESPPKRWKGMGAGPGAAGRIDRRCRIFSMWPLRRTRGGSARCSPAQARRPSPPSPYLRVCGRIFLPRRQSASALSMSSCTSSACGVGAGGVRPALRPDAGPLPASPRPPAYLHLVAVEEVDVGLALVRVLAHEQQHGRVAQLVEHRLAVPHAGQREVLQLLLGDRRPGPAHGGGPREGAPRTRPRRDRRKDAAGTGQVHTARPPRSSPGGLWRGGRGPVGVAPLTPARPGPPALCPPPSGPTDRPSAPGSLPPPAWQDQPAPSSRRGTCDSISSSRSDWSLTCSSISCVQIFSLELSCTSFRMASSTDVMASLLSMMNVARCWAGGQGVTLGAALLVSRAKGLCLGV